MTSSIYIGMKQIANVRTLFGICSIVILSSISSIDTFFQIFPVKSLQESNYHQIFILKAICSDLQKSFIPILSVLPYATSYIDELKSKYVRFNLIRTNYITYTTSCILVCFLSGWLVILIGNVLAWGVFTLLLLPMEKAGESSQQVVFLLLRTCMLMSLNGGLWAVVGMTMSAFMESKYIAYASPFIIYYLLIILCKRYLHNAVLLYPPNWTNPDVWPFGALGAALFLLELTAICGIVFIVRAGKRLREL